VSALILYRIDPARRMRRFYIMDVQPDLFGQWSFIREWGRIGSPGHVRIATYLNENEARIRFARYRRVKERHGYCPAPES
jgi:predicted DNA-binding WGR domain protein